MIMSTRSRISIRPITSYDTTNIVKWRNSDDVAKNLYTQDLLTEEQHNNWLENKVRSGECYQFIIVCEQDNTAQDVGTVFIKNIDRHNSKGEFGIFIGEPSARGKGVGTAAARLVLEFAMNELSLNRVYLTVFANNLAGIKAYERAGFKHEGILKQDYYRDGKYYDVVCMGITRDVFFKN